MGWLEGRFEESVITTTLEQAINWGRQSSVSVDLSSVLPSGRYEVRNVQDWYGSPVTTGSYSGGSISIPRDYQR